ncbi:MAG: tellurite resistance TerB family protein [Gammaproteobacteria bacterium]
MNIQSLLDQLLNAGQSALSGNAPQPGAPSKPGYANFGTGMLAGGALGLLLGDKRVRKFGGKALTYGGAAALGALAFRAYSNWQQQKAAAGAAGTPAPQPAQFLPAPASEDHSRAVLKALIAAAKSDGHIDARERGLIEQKLGGMADDPGLRRWIDEEVARPLDPAEVAAAAGSMEVATEMYLVSVLAVDSESFMERAYLDALATQLKLPADLKTQLETEARQALAAA